mgnify:CR=1 FL=1
MFAILFDTQNNVTPIFNIKLKLRPDFQENVDKMSDQLFRGIMRMDRGCFDEFASEIEMKFPKLGLSPHGHNITPRERLYIFFNLELPSTSKLPFNDKSLLTNKSELKLTSPPTNKTFWCSMLVIINM